MSDDTICQMLTISTAHIEPDLREDLSCMTCDELPFNGGETLYGWFFYAFDEDPGEELLPRSLWNIMTYAKRRGCDYVYLDRDASVVDELDVYED